MAIKQNPPKASLRDELRCSMKAVGWSAMMALSVIQVGYSLCLIMSLLAQPQFRMRFGHDINAGSGAAANFQISAAWMLAIQMSAVGSTILGAIAVG